MEQLTGRATEKALLLRALHSPEAELVAVFGRRRVGKTFLVRSVYREVLAFEFSGVHNVSLKEQLLNFSIALQQSSGAAIPPATPANWIKAFVMLERYLEPKLRRKKAAVFIDELPWLHTPKSGFLGAFGHWWNMWASRQKNLVVVICGSAASWMIQHVVNNRGGLHNRITKRIRLLPFNLHETEAYLKSRMVQLDRYQLLQLYMAFGGIPQYLKAIKPGESAAQAIDRICFTKDGALKDEFTNMYASLFTHAEHHVAIVKALAAHGKGLSRNEIMRLCELSSGGTATKVLEELEESGFISPYIPFDKRVKDSIYRLTDEYSLFYLKFMQRGKIAGEGTWLRISEGAAWRSWSGIVFEGICMKHLPQIKFALGISGVLTSESVWTNRGSAEGEPGVQIDMVLDRADHCIHICEMKYTASEFSIDKKYALELRQKLWAFMGKTKTKKTLLLTLITTYGAKQNIWYTGLVQNEVRMDQLFER